MEALVKAMVVIILQINQYAVHLKLIRQSYLNKTGNR